MRKFFIGILIFLIVVAVLHISLFAVINLKGKDILKAKIEDSTGKRPKIGELSLHFPFTFEISDFQLGDLSFAKAEIVVGSFNPFGLNLRLNKVIFEKLYLTFAKEKDRFLIEPLYSTEHPKDATQKKQEIDKESVKKPLKEKQKKREGFSLQVKNFYLKDSLIRYLDKTRKPQIDLSLSDLNLEVNNFHYPKFTKFQIDLTSFVKTKQKNLKDLIKVAGWVDYFNRNMDTTLKVDPFQYSDFSQYYPTTWQPENLGVDQAVLSLNSKFIAENNDLTIDSFLFLEKIKFTEIKEGNKKELSRQRLIKTIIGLLKSEDEKTQIHIKIKTKMDTPKIDLNVLGEGLKKSVPLGPKFVTEQLIYKAGDIVKEGAASPEKVPQKTIETTIDVLKDTVDKFKDIFKSK